MKFGAIILARLDSRRLPQKALKKIGDKTLIEHCVLKLKSNPFIEPILATSNREVDSPLIEIAEKNGIKHFAGELDNVANRVLSCINYYQLDYFVRVNGDSPFLNNRLLLKGLQEAEHEQYDFVTNLLPRTYPYGISLEVFNSEIFRRGYSRFKGNPRYEEHITSYFYDQKENYYYKNIESKFKLTTIESTETRLVVDTVEDLNRIKNMYDSNPSIFEESLKNIIHAYNKVKQ